MSSALKQITIQDDSWLREMNTFRDRFLEMVEDRYPTIWAKAKKRCESGLMANPPCSACVVRVAKEYGLETEL